MNLHELPLNHPTTFPHLTKDRLAILLSHEPEPEWDEEGDSAVGTLTDIFRRDKGGWVYGIWISEWDNITYLIHTPEYDRENGVYFNADRDAMRTYGWGWRVDETHCIDYTEPPL